MSKPTTQEVNRAFFEAVRNGDTKTATDSATDITLITIREEGLLRRVMDVEPITYAQLDKQTDTDKPVKIVDKEVSQPLSVTVPFGTLSPGFGIRGDRYRVDFARNMTRNYHGDVGQIETYDYDIRDHFKERSIRDLTYAEDVPWFNTLDDITTPQVIKDGTAWGSIPAFTLNEDPAKGDVSAFVSPLTGKIQYMDFSNEKGNPLGASDGLTRVNFIESLKVLQRGYRLSGMDQVPIRSKIHTCVLNVNTALEFAKWDHDEWGGPDAQVNLTEGITERTWHGIRFVYTLKDDIVKDGEMYMLAAPKFVGKFYELEAPVTFVDSRAFMFEFFSYALVGATIGNPYALGKVVFFHNA